MIRVSITLPNGQKIKGRIDPASTCETLKRYLIELYKLEGNVDDYELAIIPKDISVPLINITGIAEGDTIILITKASGQTPFYPDN